MTKILSNLNSFVWGVPALVLILGVGLFLSIRLRFAQLTLLPKALRYFFRQLRQNGQEDHSSFQALCTALGATVGTGNLVGVAGAICIGGPGAVFWMWVCGIFGMVIKFAEAMLAVRYRQKTKGGFLGGPMYGMLLGLGEKWRILAMLYSLFGLIAAFGVGNAAQINALITGVNGVLGRFGGGQTLPGNLLMGIGLGILVMALLSGGAKRIGAAAERLVPLAALAYILLCAGVLLKNRTAIAGAFRAILTGAFNPGAVTGGVLGSAFQTLRIGCSRGVFTNEAGMGTASIAHAEARVAHPAQQGLMGIMEVFLDTILICTLTALVILVSGVPVPYGTDQGAMLTVEAFACVYGSAAGLLICAMLACFAIATVLGWGLYGARCARFLFGREPWRNFSAAQAVTVVAASVLDTGLVWQLCETVNGLMVIPNLIMLAALSPEIIRLTKEYKKSGS